MSDSQQQSKKKSSGFSWLKFLGVPILALVIFLMAKSKDMYENLFSDWVEQCRVVIDVDYDLRKYVPIENANKMLKSLSYFTTVRLYAFGDVPHKIDLHFKSSDRILQLIKFQDPLLNENFIEHEWSDQECPVINNEFCQETLPELSSQDIYGTKFSDLHVRIPNFSTELDPKFEVFFHNNQISLQSFKVFVQETIQETKVKQPVCSVERATWKNYWAWGPDLGRFLYLLCLFIFLCWLVDVIRSKTND